MHILVTVVAVLVLAIGITIRQRQENINEGPQAQKEEVLSENNKTANSPTPSNSETFEASATEEPSLSITQAPSSLESYIYPGSTIISSGSSGMTLQSNDNVDMITDWYKDKIGNAGMSIKTFVVTEANDNVLNKLVGANDQSEISVEIEQKAGDSKVLVEVVF